MRFSEFGNLDNTINPSKIANVLDPNYRAKIEIEMTRRLVLLNKINKMVKVMAAIGSDTKDPFAYSYEWEKLLQAQTRLNDFFASGVRLLWVSRNHTIKDSL